MFRCWARRARSCRTSLGAAGLIRRATLSGENVFVDRENRGSKELDNSDRMKIAYFDCFSGASGDMLLGALVDAGVKLAALEAELRRLPVAGWSITAEKTKKKGISAMQVRVQSGEPHPHRGLSEILRLIEQGARAGISSRAAALASRIFTRLGEAEAKIHDTTVEKIHFHEVGAVDAIVDIVGASIGFEILGIEEFN